MEKKLHYSNILNVQLIGATLEAMGIEHIVFSPGSRNGALIMHLNSIAFFKTYTIVDERSAAYTALGMAQKLKKPVVICCTSGSAAANYYPAVTEAFYQNIPLIVLTADRPRSYIDQFNGQTIRQENLFKNHSYHNENLLEEDTDEALTQNFLSLKKSILKCIEHSGPVHINFPLSEPLYETTSEIKINFERITIPKKLEHKVDYERLNKIAVKQHKIMFLVGMHDFNEEFNQLICDISENNNVIFLTENTSNLHNNQIINRIDSAIFVMPEDKQSAFAPDLLITLGQNIVSKKIKQFLRKNKPKHHWHVNSYWQPDTFNALTEEIKTDSINFLKAFKNFNLINVSDYKKNWLNLREVKGLKQAQYLKEAPFSDLKSFEYVIKNLPRHIAVHYSNSSVIRYAQLFNHHESIDVYCNRGTSGIDGSTSTAIGYAMQSDKSTTLITGDLSFFYDSNGLWNNYIPKDFRIILINNGGGEIFKIIPGPDKTGVLDQSFFAPHNLNPKHLANLYHFEYVEANDLNELKSELKTFWLGENKKILSINTFNINNSEILKGFIKA